MLDKFRQDLYPKVDLEDKVQVHGDGNVMNGLIHETLREAQVEKKESKDEESVMQHKSNT